MLDFFTRDRPDQAVFVDLLVAPARTTDGVLKLDADPLVDADLLFYDPHGVGWW
ncbi:hypothetical protein ABZ816_22560 [Actinosynnema sp. NPDC047251]|uniref:hypothetical protein n=1 Tax=Saccharothrix espanaensis TaxID=103731 RepID=UPI000312171E|nr:hypothetical protein [Saccharothrix espanaensis]